MRLALTVHDRHLEGMALGPSLARSPDGRCFATAARECDIALWDVQTGIHMMTLEYAGEIMSLEFLADDQLASGNSDGEISLWDIVTGTRVRTFQAHSDEIFCLSASQTMLASGSGDKTVRVWDTTSWECMRTIECDHGVKSVVLYPKGDRVAACTWATFYVWEIATQQLIASKGLMYYNVSVSNDGKFLAIVAYKTILLYDASTLDCIWSHVRDSRFISFSPDSSQLVSISSGVELLDVQTGDRVKSFNKFSVARAVVSHDGTRLLSGESCSLAL